MKRFILFLCFFFVLSSCSSSHNHREVKVGIDPSWYPLQFGGREKNVNAFSTELLTEIGKIEKIPFVKVVASWDNLMLHFQKGAYQAILSSMPPYLFNQKHFAFSELYLPLGAVLVVPTASSIHSLSQLGGKIVGVVSGSGNELLIEKVAGVMVRSYEGVAPMLNALDKHTIDGALVDILTATAYCQDIYQNTLHIVTPPLDDRGLRFITPSDNPHLVHTFNQGLEKLKKS